MPATSPALTRRAVLALTGTALAAPFVLRDARASTGRTAVVELFTSQGCSSCPPADRVLGELIEGGEAIGLAHHVTYWDYLGWADPLASEAGTRRQYAYAEAFGRRGVYTPQAVVNGRTHHVGSQSGEVRAALSDGVPTLPLHIERAGGTLRIEIAGGAGEGEVTLMRYRVRSVHAIERGENRGRTLAYHHPVRAIERLGAWTGEARRFEAHADDDGVAVLVQGVGQGAGHGAGLGPILGAASLQAPAG